MHQVSKDFREEKHEWQTKDSLWSAARRHSRVNESCDDVSHEYKGRTCHRNTYVTKKRK